MQKRVIKFRAKSIEADTWIYGFYFYDGFSWIVSDNGIQPSYGKSCLFHKVYVETLTQFTGLLDKNGKEIFEGDIINAGEDKPLCVGWHKDFASFVITKEGWMFPHFFGEGCEPENCLIIGNIFENPELLK